MNTNQLRCSSLNSAVELDNVIMFMPGGVSTITPSQNNKAVTVTVLIDAKSAKAIQLQYETLIEAGKKPYFSIGENSHKSDIAAFRPSRFFWATRKDVTGKMATGVWCEGEWTRAGREAVEGKDFNAFSPTFFVDAVRNDPNRPAQVVCESEANPNMGALVNDPAFVMNSPLCCKNAATEFPTSDEVGSAGVPAISQNKNTGDKMKSKNVSLAELQARKESLETEIGDLSGKTDALSKAKLEGKNFEMESINEKIERIGEQEEVAETKIQLQARREKDADDAVAVMIGNMDVGPQEKERIEAIRKDFIAHPENIAIHARRKSADQRAVAGKMTPGPTRSASATELQAGATYEISGGTLDVPSAFKAYWQLLARNASVKVNKHMSSADRNAAFATKAEMALESANFYNRHLKKNIQDWEHIPMTKLGLIAGCITDKNGALQAGDVTGATTDGVGNPLDPTNTLGTLSGTLVLQRTLPMFAWKYPALMSMFTDFSDTPGLYEQSETTRIVSALATEKYDATADTAGRPKGWTTVSPAVTTDASIKLSDYIGIPIVFGQSALAATTRKLFDEQAFLAIKAIADYFTGMMTKLMTPANFNSFAVVNGTTVKVANPTYVKAAADYSQSDFDNIDAYFTDMKVPEEDRIAFLATAAYAKLRGDMRLVLQYATAGGKTVDGASEFVTEAKLPKLSGFAPYKAPYLPTTNNLVSFFAQKAAIILKSRLPQDFTQALGVMVPGSVTTITDPDTKISVMLVQYVHLTAGYAEWRPEVILGAAVGDKRAGLCGTSA